MTEAIHDVRKRALELAPAERLKLAHDLLESAGAKAGGLFPADERLRALFHHSPMAIGFSRDGVTVHASPAYARIFGFDSGEELVGTSILDVIAPRARADVIAKVECRARGEDVPDTYETVGIRKDGTEFPFQVHVTRVVLEDGPLTMASLHDITDREPLEARDGREALELFRARQGEIACVLLDLTMPVMDGLEALEEVRRLAPTTPVVVTSGYGEEHAQARLAAHEGVVFIAKPYPSSALADALRRALGCARPSS